MASPTTTLLAAVEAVALNLGLLEQGTATSGAAAGATLVCASWPFLNASANANSSKYLSDEIKLTSGVAALLGNLRGIITYAASTGTFTPSSAFGAPTAITTETFDIYKRGVRYNDIKGAINQALRERRYEGLWPLTMLADGDFEASGTTAWGTASGCTFTKVATAGNLLRGAQAGKIVNSGAGGYLPSAALTVVPGDSYCLEAKVRAAVGTASLIAYDSSNSVAITTETWDKQGWGKISFTFTLPSTCESLTVRLAGTGASDDCYWDDVILRRTGSREVALPDWVVDPAQVMDLYTSSGGSDDFDEDLYSLKHYNVLPDAGNPLNMYKIAPVAGVSGPLWIRARKAYAELSADTDTTIMPVNWLTAAATYQLLERLVNRHPGQETIAWKAESSKWARRTNALDRHYLPVEMRIEWGVPPNVPTSVF